MGAIAKLSEKEIADRLGSVPGWSLDNGKLYREFRFSDFVEAFGFMARVAVIAQQQDHHPEWFNVYSTVRVHLSTHDAGGISERDFRLAKEMSARFDGARSRA
jgi:4a-hydroxytetrahydrobiopterin dehydratase